MTADITLSKDTIALFVAIEDNDGVECSKVPDIFFPEDLFQANGISANTYRLVAEMEETARAICMKCPVMALCLKVGFYEDYGIFGGTTPKQRRELRREKQI